MQVDETKTSAAANKTIQKKRQPFFNKEGQGSFFSKSNQHSNSFFSPTRIQPKLTIGQPNDKYEVEADAMADKVVQRLNNTKRGTDKNSPFGGQTAALQTKCSECEKEEKLQKKEEPLASKITSIQRKPIFESNTEETETRQDSLLQKKCVHCDQEKKLQKQEEEEREGIQAKSNSGSQTLELEEEKLQTKSTGTPNHLSGLEGRLRSAGNGGRTMAPDLQKSIGDAFGADFSKVRIHTTGKAVQMNRELRAQAFTHGQDIYFNEGKYRPETSSGKHLLAHELTHTLQQGTTGKSINTKLEHSDGFALKTSLAKSRQGGKQIEESENTGRQEFTKIQKKSVPTAGADSLNHGSSSLKKLISHKPLQFVQAKKKDLEIDKDLEEKEGAGIQMKMDTLLRDSGRDRKDEFMKGRSWEEDQADKMILFKKEPSLQLSPAGPSDETSMRNRIVEVSKKELGKVEARRDDGAGRRVGADRLLEYFHLAAPNEWPDAVIEQSRYTMEAKQFPHWCGIFSVYAIKKAGIDVGDWKMGVGVSQFNTLQQTDMPQKGDIGYIHEPWRHHCIITEVNGDTIKSIDGNSGTKSEVLERTRPITEYTGFFTAFTGSEKYIQQKEETADSTSNINGLEQELDAASGKGVPLDTEPRGQMERGFGADFGDANIHTDSQAVRMNKNLGAQAFTHGKDIYFNAGKYRPETASGKHLLAHELTHTVQQGASNTNLKEQKALLKKIVKNNNTVHIQKRAWYEVDIPFTDYHFDPSIEGLKTAANLTKDTALAGGKFVYDKGKAFLVEQINRIAPGLLEFLNGDWKEIIKSKISSAIDKLFGKLISKVQTMGLIGIITNFVGQLAGDIVMASSNLAAKTQAAVSKASRAIFKFVSSLSRPLIKAFQKVSGQFVSVLGGIWNKLALPAFEAVQSVAGSTWTWLKSKAEWVWKQIVKVKNLLSEAWDWIKEKFNIAWAGAGSVWSWIKDKIKAAWDAVYAFIKPVIGPLKHLSSVFKLFSSKGPLTSLGNAATSFWNYAFLLIQLINFPKLFIQAGLFLKNVVLPALLKVSKQVAAFLTVGFSWLASIFNAVTTAFKSLVGVLKGVILSVIKAVVQAVEMAFSLVKSLFIGLVGYLVEIINDIINDFWGFLFRLSTFLGGIVLIILNPTNWFPFAAAVFAKIAWTLIPRFLKPAAIDFLIKATLTGIDALSSPPMLGPLWKVLVRGMTGLLRRIQRMDPDRQIKFVEKLINTGINPRYYSGFQIGVIKGIVWDGLVGLFMTIVDIFRVLPELISGIYNFFKEMLADVPSIKKFLGTLKKLGKDVEKFLKDPKALDQIVELIKKSPQILFSMVKKAFEVAKNWANEAGDKIVESLFAFVLNNDAFNIGLKVGTVVGMILFEILLLVFSGTIGNIVKWGGKALRLISSGLKALLKGIKTGGGLIMKGFRAIGTVASAGWKVITKVVKGGLAKVFNRMKKLMDDLIAWFKKLFQRAFGKKKKGPKKKPTPRKKPKSPGEARWQVFKLAVVEHFAKFQKDGLSKPQAKIEFKKVVLKFKKVARLPFRSVSTEYGFYNLLAKKRKKGIIARIVGKVPMPTMTRWKKGNRAVRKRLKKLKSNEYSTSGINLAIKPYIGRYKYALLEAKWDAKENDWDIMAEMNPKGKIAEVDKDQQLPDGTRKKPIPITWYKNRSQYLPLSFSNFVMERWKGYTPRSPVSTPTIAFGSTNWVEIPPTQYRSFPSSGPLQSRYKVKTGSSGRRFIKIGVENRFMPRIGTLVKRQRAKGKSRAMQGRFRTLMKNYNNTSGRQMDHVIDIGLGGKYLNADHINNLWPLKVSANQAGNKVYGQEVKFWDASAKKARKARIFELQHLNKKYFKIVKFK